MFLIKIFHFLRGYVILSLIGHNKEEFLNSAVNLGINIFKTKVSDEAIMVWMPAGDFLKVRRIKSRPKIRIINKRGLIFVLKNTRKSFLVGMIISILLIVLSSGFIWDISFEGVENCDVNQLYTAVKKAGLTKGMPKYKLKSGYEMKNIILNNTEDICWVWVYVKGTRAVVSVRENIIPPDVFDPDTPCDIIASRSGIIKSIQTVKGRCIKEENQMVAPGDVIISGTYEFEKQPGYQVHAKGTVRAETQHIRWGLFKQNYCYKKYTGRKERKIVLNIFGRRIPLYFKEDSRFQNSDSDNKKYDLKIGEYYIGLGVDVKTSLEYIEEKEPISYESAVDFAEKQLEKEIAGELLPGAELINRDLNVERNDEETMKVTLTMNFIEEIGTEKRIDEVTIIEPKTDRANGQY